MRRVIVQLMKQRDFVSFICGLVCVSSAAVACGGGEGSSGDGDSSSGDGDSAGDGDGDGDGDVEAPASCSILEAYVGSYSVTGVPTENTHRGEPTAQHDRGTVIVGEDLSIDFDTSVSFSADEISTCYDRTNQEHDRRIQISYGVDDNGEVINLYLDSALEVEEVQFRHNESAINIRVLVE